MDDLRACMPGRWMHSHEEDTANTEVYRPASYRFPPARGRTGFELSADGRAEYLGIAAADGTDHLAARWELQPGNELRITVTEQQADPMVLTVLSCDSEKMTVSR
ncbi:MAG: hypothetical protein QM650_02170 [Microlunatus sp.]